MVFVSGGNPEEPDLPVLGHFGCPNIIIACLGWVALLISAKKNKKKKAFLEAESERSATLELGGRLSVCGTQDGSGQGGEKLPKSSPRGD